MLFKRTIVKTPLLSFVSPTKIVFDENIEFTCFPRTSDNVDYKFQLHDIKGEFEIIKIQPKCYTRGDKPVKLDKSKNEFVIIKNVEESKEELCDFAITIDAECKKVDFIEDIIRTPYTLFIPDFNLRNLNVYEYLEGVIVLSGGLKFTYYINKSKEDKVEIIVKNEYSVEISDKKPENKPVTWHASKRKTFRHQACDYKDLELTLWFMYNKDDVKILEKEESDEVKDQEEVEKDEESPTEQSDFVMFKNNTYINMKKLSLFDVMSDPTYSDVIFKTANGVEVLSYRCILAKSSKTLTRMFQETTVLPFKINAEEFSDKTVKAALDFCYGKHNAIAGKEITVYDFAKEFGFTKLKKICLQNIESQINLENVYEIIQIAYSKEIIPLKNLCKKIIKENKAELDPSKLFKLPPNIGDDLDLFS